MCELNGESAHEGLRGEGARKSRETDDDAGMSPYERGEGRRGTRQKEPQTAKQFWESVGHTYRMSQNTDLFLESHLGQKWPGSGTCPVMVH